MCCSDESKAAEGESKAMEDKSKAAEGMECLTPYCSEEALAPLLCGHRFCSRCTLGVVKFFCPGFPILMLRCPLCREEQPLSKWSFYTLVYEHFPKGAMLLECCGPLCEGFALVIWESIGTPPDRKIISAEKVGQARRKVRRRREEVHEPPTFDFTTIYLPAANYVHLLEDATTSSAPEEFFDLRNLFDVLAQKAQCSESAKQLLMESAGENVPIRLLGF